MNLQTILEDIYAKRDTDGILRLLQGYGLDTVLDPIVVRASLLPKTPASTYQDRLISHVSNLAVLYLTNVNAVVQSIEDSEEKKDVKVVVADIASHIIQTLVETFKGDTKKLLTSLMSSIELICDVNQYDTDDLFNLFQLPKMIRIHDHYLKECSNPIYYEWLSTPYNLNDLCVTLKRKGIIKNSKEFHKLFKKPESDFKVLFNRNYFGEIVVLFDMLYDLGHIEPRGGKGHFMPLSKYAVDFESNPLIDSPANKLKYGLKKNERKWQVLIEEITSWTIGFKTKS